MLDNLDPVHGFSQRVLVAKITEMDFDSGRS
jgi:hypothetical protein